MSIALQTNSNHPIDRSGFVPGMSCVSISDSKESGRAAGIFADDRRFLTANAAAMKEVVEELDSCSSSSIGRNSDASGGSSAGDGDSGEAEVQSSYRGSLDTLHALEEVLPIKRGISKFYGGKSKSFTSLADASSYSSITDIAKPENLYTRKRKNLIAYSAYFDKNRNGLRGNGGGISKRPANSRSTLALAVTMSSSELNNNSDGSNSSSSSPTRCLPPLHPHSRRTTNGESVVSFPNQKFSPWRSLSLSDLQGAAAATSRITDCVIGNRVEMDKPC